MEIIAELEPERRGAYAGAVGYFSPEALPPLEIAPKSGFYDYSSKYTKGATEYIVPARIGVKVGIRLQHWTEEIYNAIECDGTARADFIVPSDNEAYFLEINTIPGMTELSLVPKAAAHVGITFDEVCERPLDGAKLLKGEEGDLLHGWNDSFR
jgi:D-alanine-D-alanine ligase